MLKDKILEIKNTEAKTKFGRKESQVRLYEYEINHFCDEVTYKMLSFMDKIRFILNDFIDLYIGDVEKTFEKHLIRADGKINSPLLRNVHVKKFIERVDNYQPKLRNYNVEHKWYYIKNNLSSIPTCDGCGKVLDKFVLGVRFCTQKCAATSDEAKHRASVNNSGRKMSDEFKKQNSERMKELWKTDEHRNKVLPLLKEASKGNGKNFLKEDGKPWNYGLSPSQETIKKALKTKKERGVDLSGKNNPQFGKSPSPQAGRGINGKFKGCWFRSSLELFYLMYFDELKISFRTAETSEFKVEYEINNITKTYSPDFYLIDEDKIIEIKPSMRVNENLNKLKMQTLRNKFGETKCEFRTELDIKDFISKVSFKKINDIIKNKDLELSDKQKERLLSNLKGIKYDYTRNF